MNMRLSCAAGLLGLLCVAQLMWGDTAERETLAQQAKAYRAIGHYPKAIALYKELLDQKFEPDRMHLELARCYLGLLQGSTALSHLREVKGARAKSATLPELKGRCHLLLGEYDAAVAAFQQALARNPASFVLQYYLARASRRAGQRQLALKLLNTLIRNQPHHALGLMERGILHQEERRWSEAEQDFLTHLSLFPQNVEVHYRLARVLFALGAHDEAERHVDLHKKYLVAGAKRQITDLGLIDESLRRARAEQLHQGGRLDEARALIEAYLPLDPNNPHLLFQLARLYQQLKQSDRATAVITRLLATEHDTYLVPYYAGRYFYLQRRFVRAEPHLRRAVTLAPPLPEPFDLLGYIAIQRGQPERARALLEQAVTRQSTMLSTYVNLAELLRRTEQSDRAITLLETALTLHPRAKSAYSALINLYRAQNQPAKAEELLLRMRAVE